MTYLTKQQVEEMFGYVFAAASVAEPAGEAIISFIHSLREKDLEAVKDFIHTLPAINIKNLDEEIRGVNFNKQLVPKEDLLSHLDTLKK